MENRRYIDLSNLPEDYVTAKFREYANRVTYSSYSHTYNGGCPICHEGKSWGKKHRCWWNPSEGYIHCFNCGETWSPVRFIREASGMSNKQICDEIRSGLYDYEDLDKPISTRFNEEEPSREEEAIIQSIEKLPDNSIDLSNKTQVEYYKDSPVLRACVKYMLSRRLNTAVNRPTKYFLCLGDDYTHKNRLVFPFYNQRGQIVFYQTRSIGEMSEKPDVRYLSKFSAEKSLFNIDKVDPDIKEVFIFEGPIDSCFVKNGIAVAGISAGDRVDLGTLQSTQLEGLSLSHEFIWVLDSQWLDETSRVKTTALLQQGYKVFLWPKELGTRYKDVNDYCTDNGVDEFPVDIILSNVGTSEDSIYFYDDFDNRSKEEKAIDTMDAIDSLI